MSDLVLLTGASGFIAKHVALDLLTSGYRVRGTLRNLDRSDEVHAALLEAGGDTTRLEFVRADLGGDAGWADAAAGCRFLVHTASPFPARQPRDRFGLVPVARDGALRAVGAALRAGAERIVLTSSVVAVYLGHESRADHVWSERDWSNVDGPGAHAYGVSKTEAERAAWAAVEAAGGAMVAVNPALVLGPLLDRRTGTSADVVAMMMRGVMPAVPAVSFGIVDVRDVARAHVAALTATDAVGHRFILSGGTRSLLQLGAGIARAEPAYRRRVPRFALPDALVRAAAAVIPSVRTLVPDLGRGKQFDTAPAETILGLRFRPPEEAIAAMAKSLRRFRIV
ncbi:NAD-dependent epimerase/dehydratase family protein [Antarcticirhabdus aurantiaca]|uniref:NAD-dependent epimerase/dehydratase family protein n=1 Tax=Antarcticirhabdus aurantiaca TaxID=2606717 RepID=A0ACD4NVN2_9HYPH|nr:NAD-dependent epimerase/dehydratase family protein [Antarcticirhabdus aurantiaca]WAJ30838.1 NAD-dependent epimerase/dehydratase family protein [Jeongeuplla avenae]